MLPHGWYARFYDATRRVMLTKPGRNQSRKIHLRFDAFGLRRIDRHGNPLNDTINPIAQETRGELLVACRERWG